VAIESMHDDRVELKDRIGKMEESSRRGNEATLKAIQQDNKQTRGTTIVTALTSVVAIVGGIAAFNATVLSNMLASFESGRNTATSIVQATEQMRQTQERLDRLSIELEKRTSTTVPPKSEAPESAKP
jgi:3-oxoacyl-ACP reductase-like protein